MSEKEKKNDDHQNKQKMQPKETGYIPRCWWRRVLNAY